MTKEKDLKVGFEMEVIFRTYGYPELVDQDGDAYLGYEDDVEVPHSIRKKIAEDLGEYIGEKVIAPENEDDVLTKQWSVKSEVDIDVSFYEDVACVVEIITTPKSISKALKDLDLLFRFCEEKGAYTDTSCGLHMTFDVLNKENTSLLSIAMSIDEETLLKKFSRDANAYTIPQSHKLLVESASAKLEGSKQALEHDFLSSVLGKGKSFGINFDKVVQYGVVEFRHCGGENIFYKIDQLKEIVMEIQKVILDASKTKNSFVCPVSFQDDVEAVMQLANDLTLSEQEPDLMSVKSYKVFLKEEEIGNIGKNTLGKFNFHFSDYNLKSTPLNFETLTKAKLFAAMSILRNGNRVDRLQSL